MSPRTGRPTNNPRGTNRTGVRLTDSDMRKLEFCIKETGMTKTEVIRTGIDLVYEQIIKKENLKGEVEMELVINYPEDNHKEDIGRFWTEKTNGEISEMGWRGKFAGQWLLKVQKKEECLVLNINDKYLVKQNLDK